MIFVNIYLKLLFTRSNFQPKIHQITFGGRLCTDPLGSLQRSPRLILSELGEPTSKGRRWESKEVGKGLEGGNEREWREMGEKRKENEGRIFYGF